MKDSLIHLQNINKFYLQPNGQTISILESINLELQIGEIVALLGPSGSGKSTLLHILGLLEEASEGEYILGENPVQKLSEKKRTELHRTSIGFVFQAYHLIDELTVYENIETPLLYKGQSSSERKSRVADVLDRFNIVAKKDLFPSQLSGGQQQLVGIARAIVAEPKIIFADEPTGNLDPDNAWQVIKILKKLNSFGVTVLLTTHDEQLVRAANHPVLHLHNGYIV